MRNLSASPKNLNAMPDSEHIYLPTYATSPSTLTSWTVLNFGKHKGKTLPQVLLSDPDWFFWAFEEEVFRTPSLARESQLLNERARNIRIPKNEYSDPVAEYLIYPPTKKFLRFEIVPRSQKLHDGGTPAYRLSVIDISFPRRIAPYDKSGCKSLIASLKFYIFGCRSTRITKERAERFFSQAENFR